MQFLELSEEALGALVKNQVAEPDSLGLNLASSTYQLCDLGQSTSLVLKSPIYETGVKMIVPSTRFLWRINVYKNLEKCQAYEKCYTSASCEYFYDIGGQDIILGLEH